MTTNYLTPNPKPPNLSHLKEKIAEAKVKQAFGLMQKADIFGCVTAPIIIEEEKAPPSIACPYCDKRIFKKKRSALTKKFNYHLLKYHNMKVIEE